MNLEQIKRELKALPSTRERLQYLYEYNVLQLHEIQDGYPEIGIEVREYLSIPENKKWYDTWHKERNDARQRAT